MTYRRLVVWRHGRTAWNASGLIQGQTDVGLDEVGVQQASAAAARLASLSPAWIVSSDLSRAYDTATSLATLCGLTVGRDRRLREMSFGIREGLSQEEAQARYPDEMARFLADPTVPLPGAESYGQVGERFAAAITDAVAELAPGATGVLVAHGAAMRVGILAFLGIPQQHWTSFSGFSNCCWAVLEDRPRGWCVTEWNAGSLPEPVLSDDERSPD